MVESRSFVAKLVQAGICAAAIALSSLTAYADTLPKPKGRVILTISGNIAHHNGDGTAQFDREMLEKIGLRDLTTRTFYSKEQSNFSGIHMRDLLDHVGATGAELEVVAIDDYRIVAPITDYYKYGVLLVTRLDGKALSIRQRGPTRIIYPVEKHAELQDKKYASRYVWQIKHMKVK